MIYKLYNLEHVPNINEALDIINCILIDGYKDFISCETDAIGNVTFNFNAANEMKYVYHLISKSKGGGQNNEPAFEVITDVNSHVTLIFNRILSMNRHIIFHIKKSDMFEFKFSIQNINKG